jgi:RNA polymerase sigma-70 factor, ECF subfamily
LNEDTFEKLILQHRDFLVSYSRKLTKNSEESEDIVQETIISAFKHRNTYRAKGAFRSWLASILLNKYINNYHAQQRNPQVDISTFPDYLFLPTLVSAGAERVVFRKLECRAIHEAMQVLPDEYRRVIELSDMEGLSYLEISDQLDIPLGTVRSRLSRARNRIRRALYVWESDL